MCNEKKIAFIICSNNELYYKECVWYISDLKVPEGYETDIICITDADSMAEAYNAAMESSNAKYKVYMHQDVFIYNKDFIENIINIFKSDEQLGMLGMIGGIHLPENAVIWNAWNRGATYACNNKCTFTLVYGQNPEKNWTEVEAVDGMMLITQYDIRWRDDLELGWDFYDISQSMEFKRKGFKVGIPFQEKPWCIHDCGHSKLINYDFSRKKFLKEYKDFFSGEFAPLYSKETFLFEEKIFGELKRYLEQKNFERAYLIKEMVGEKTMESNNLEYALNFVEIYEKEKMRESQSGSFFRNTNTWEEMKEKYDTVKFMIRHIHHGTDIQKAEELLNMIKSGILSSEAVVCVAQHSV